MTRDEIESMSAGEEMDNLVAEKFMGWHKDVDKSGFISWIDKDGHYQHGVADDGYEDVEDFHLLKFHPSQSILWAWDIVEKLCNETGCDVIKVCKRDPELLRGEWSCNFGSGFEAFGETAPHAICRAALISTLGKQ